MERETSINGFVLDTSVVLKWFSEYGEDDLDRAFQIREYLLEGSAHFIVPELLFYELANALRYNPRFSTKDVSEAIDSVFDMEMEVARIDKRIMEEAIALAFKYHITVYDAYFLGLSRAEGKPLITADYKFFEKMKGYNPTTIHIKSSLLWPVSVSDGRDRPDGFSSVSMRQVQ